MSLQNLYLSWGEILSPNWKASWSFYTHGRHTQGQCLGMYGDQAASFSRGGKQGFKVQPRHGRKVDPWCQPVLPSSSQTSIFLPLQSSRVPSWICWGPFGPLSSPAFPPWHRPSAFTRSSRRSSPQTTLPLPPPPRFPLPCFYPLPRAEAAESLSKHASSIKWPLSALFTPTGIQKETRINTENNSSQIAGFFETIRISTSIWCTQAVSTYYSHELPNFLLKKLF